MSIVMAFDYGERRIGVAVGNTILRTAQSLTTVQGANRNEQLSAIDPLVKEWGPEQFVVGLPMHANEHTNEHVNEQTDERADAAERPHPVAQRARTFARQLEERFKKPVALVDERFTSQQAERQLRGAQIKGSIKSQLDSASAQIILQQYFDQL
jgi:putative holliday junction resolvase